MPTIREQLAALSTSPAHAPDEQDACVEGVQERERALLNPFERAEQAARVVGEQAACSGGEVAAKKDRNPVDKGSKAAKQLRVDPNQPTLAAFFKGAKEASADVGAKEASADLVPDQCDEWDKQWQEGTEGMEIRSRSRRHGDVGLSRGVALCTSPTFGLDGGPNPTRGTKNDPLVELDEQAGDERPANSTSCSAGKLESRGNCQPSVGSKSQLFGQQVTNSKLGGEHANEGYIHADGLKRPATSAAATQGNDDIVRFDDLLSQFDMASRNKKKHSAVLQEGAASRAKCVVEDGDSSDEWVNVATSALPKRQANANKNLSRDTEVNDTAIAIELQRQEYEAGSARRKQRGAENDHEPGGQRRSAFVSQRQTTNHQSDDPTGSTHSHQVDRGDGREGGRQLAASAQTFTATCSSMGRVCKWGAKCRSSQCKYYHPVPVSESATEGIGAGKIGCEEHERRKAKCRPGDENLPGELGPEYRDAWDKWHVRLPCSPQNRNKDKDSRWLKIRRAMSPAEGFTNVSALIRAILGYMGKPAMAPSKWTFRALENVVENWFSVKERKRFFQTTLPFIIKSALALPTRCPEPIPLLRAGRKAAVNLSSLQIVSLLANAFLCTFPEDSRSKGEQKFPRFNFYMLFEAQEKPWNRRQDPVQQHTQKLLCILHYFERQEQRSEAELAQSLVTFQRRCLEHDRNWGGSQARIGNIKLEVMAAGRIEDHDPTGGSLWEADFANCMIGGGVLGSGCVQEEIRFLLSPELIASLLITERMNDLESVLITGSERFSKYRGYASTFEFDGDFCDTAHKDVVGKADDGTNPLCSAEYRRKTTITVMDAKYFGTSQYASQFTASMIRRELNKAFVAFQHREAFGDGGDGSGVIADRAMAVATGNWGCGAFGGDLVLKSVIQILAAAESERNLKYFTFDNHELSAQIAEIFGVLCDGDEGEGCTVGQVWRALQQFQLGREHQVVAPAGGSELREYLLHYSWKRSEAIGAGVMAPMTVSTPIVENKPMPGAGHKRERIHHLTDSEDEKETAKKKSSPSGCDIKGHIPEEANGLCDNSKHDSTDLSQ